MRDTFWGALQSGSVDQLECGLDLTQLAHVRTFIVLVISFGTFDSIQGL